MVFHAVYEGNPESVDGLPGGAEWRKRSKRFPRGDALTALHEDHLVRVTERDRPLLNGDLLPAFSWTATAPDLRMRLDALEASGVTEVLYAPMGPDVPRELRTFAEMATTHA